uniref:Uncharacterized protein n=1 Tax=Solanum tuberosum TaxID=4113 RepID=M1DSA2_SOLTU
MDGSTLDQEVDFPDPGHIFHVGCVWYEGKHFPENVFLHTKHTLHGKYDQDQENPPLDQEWIRPCLGLPKEIRTRNLLIKDELRSTYYSITTLLVARSELMDNL